MVLILDSEVRGHTNPTRVRRERIGCLIAAQWTWPGSEVELNHRSCPHMNDPREGQQRDKKGTTRAVGKAAWQTDKALLSWKCSVLSALSLFIKCFGCTRAEGMRRRAACSSPWQCTVPPSASSSRPSPRLTHVSTCPPQSSANIYPTSELQSIYLHNNRKPGARTYHPHLTWSAHVNVILQKWKTHKHNRI